MIEVCLEISIKRWNATSWKQNVFEMTIPKSLFSQMSIMKILFTFSLETNDSILNQAEKN